MSDRNGNSLLWFLAGLGVGAAVGVLFAPKAEAEIRQAIRERAEEGRDFVKDRAREATGQASDWVERGRDYLNQQRDQFKSAYDAGRQAYQDTTTGAPETPKNV